MTTFRTNITLGTAGHIDHGKTLLIKCLTGCDTDRLKIEKQRGMSIDLGFAPLILSEKQVGIVDVPGHENFIKTMVAGVTGIDGIIFVIAADDGIMPQTREHLDILSLLGIKKGIVVLTKTDRVSSEQLVLVERQVKEYLRDTFLRDSSIVPFSSITGRGSEELITGLRQLVDIIVPRKTTGIFRMPVERTFSLRGYGTVVTGIPVSGEISLGDEVIVLPQRSKSRIRAIQVYKSDSTQAVCGQCAAINVPQCDHHHIKRGDVLTIESFFEPTQWLLCRLKALENTEEPIKYGQKIKFHSGTCEVAGTVYFLESDKIEPGDEQVVQIRLNDLVVVGPGDKFILRLLSPVRTIGGGCIVELLPKKLKRTREDISKLKEWAKSIDNERDFIYHAIKTAPNFVTDAEAVARRCKYQPELVLRLLGELIKDSAVLKPDSRHFITKDNFERLEKQIVTVVNDYHRAEPASPGIEVKQLLERSCLDRPAFDCVLKTTCKMGQLCENKGRIAVAGHKEQFASAEQRIAEDIESIFKRQLFNPPGYREVADMTRTRQNEIEKIIQLLVQQKRLVRTSDNLIFHRSAVEKAAELVREHIVENGILESVKFKYLLNTTRKYAIPLLDHLDQIGITRRVGNTRYLK